MAVDYTQNEDKSRCTLNRVTDMVVGRLMLYKALEKPKRQGARTEEKSIENPRPSFVATTMNRELSEREFERYYGHPPASQTPLSRMPMSMPGYPGSEAASQHHTPQNWAYPGLQGRGRDSPGYYIPSPMMTMRQESHSRESSYGYRHEDSNPSRASYSMHSASPSASTMRPPIQFEPKTPPSADDLFTIPPQQENRSEDNQLSMLLAEIGPAVSASLTSTFPSLPPLVPAQLPTPPTHPWNIPPPGALKRELRVPEGTEEDRLFSPQVHRSGNCRTCYTI